MAREESNIDPFNAGEPTLPWDEAQEDEVPRSEVPRRPDAGRRRRTGAGDSRPSGRLGDRLRVERERSRARVERFRAENAPRVEAAAAAEGSKGAGRRSSRGCGCALALIFALLIVGGIGAAIFPESSESTRESPAAIQTPDIPRTQGLDTDAGREEIRESAVSFLDAVSDDPVVRAGIAERFSDLCESRLDLSPDQLGIDADAFAAWLVPSFSYSIDSTYCFDGENPDGSAFYNADALTVQEGAEAFLKEVRDHLKQGRRGGTGSGSSSASPTSEEREWIQSRFDALLKVPATAPAGRESAYRLIEYGYSGGAWTFNRDDAIQTVVELFYY